MRNFVQDDVSLQMAAPTGGVTGGNMGKVGGLIGVWHQTAAEGEQAVLMLRGVFSDIPKATGAGKSFAVGAAAYWDDTNKRLDVTDNSGANQLAGYVTEAASTSDTTAILRLKN